MSSPLLLLLAYLISFSESVFWKAFGWPKASCIGLFAAQKNGKESVE